ncbi:MAG: CDP-glycerol glycerophosphotransferase family protein [Methanobrevibacter sp.]|jgi:hypothetical protein|nr:CDP-glycerol glycerophosphotransferase family protein [Candidatus Methanoflexus mossambicus]
MKIFNKILNRSNSYNYYKSENLKLEKKLEECDFKYNNLLEKIDSLNTIENNLKELILEIDNIKIQNNLNRLKNKTIKGKKINILFITDVSNIMWDSLIELLEKDPIFNPKICVIPPAFYFDLFKNGIDEVQKKAFDDIYTYFKNKGFNVIKGFNEEFRTFIDIESELNPDIIFYSNPHPSAFPPEYRISNLSKNLLYCYIPYSMNNHESPETIFNRELHKKAWKLFYETKKHVELSTKYSDVGSSNVVLVGCSRMDSLVDGSYEKYPKIWESKNFEKIKIVWAPHHTINISRNKPSYSTFLDNYKFFYEYAKSNKNIEWIFKPHPNLIHTIKHYNERYDNNNEEINLENFQKYYEKWNKLPNASLHDKGDYINIFVNSDAMITDSVSFISEYLYFNKPGLLLRNPHRKLNEFGEIASKGWYQVDGNDFEGIEDFIDTVLVKKEDSLENNRKEIYDKYLNTKGITAGNTIYNHIKKEILDK